MLSDQDSCAVDRLLEHTSKLVLSFGRCVGNLGSLAVFVAREITLLLRRKYLLGWVMILHDRILAIMAKTVKGLIEGRVNQVKRAQRVFPDFFRRQRNFAVTILMSVILQFVVLQHELLLSK